jgi:hypothetical protein
MGVLLAFPALAQSPPPVGVSEPETVYSDAQREKDELLSRKFVQSLLKPSTSLEGQFAKWKTPICPHVVGLDASAAYVLEKRIRDIAKQIGAPVDRRDPCKPNIVIYVTQQPKELLNVLSSARKELFAASPLRELRDLRYPVQAWYFGYVVDWYGNRTMDIDCWLFPFDCGTPTPISDTHLRSSLKSEMAAATILVDFDAVQGVTLGSLGDYLALMTLAQTPATGRCQPAPSMANLFVKGCAADLHVTALSYADLAMLTALYQTPDEPERLQVVRIIGNMQRDLGGGK